MEWVPVLKEGTMPFLITVSIIILISLLSSDWESKNPDVIMGGFFENFHLNSTSVFLGYLAFQLNRFFVLEMIFCGICYFLEHKLLKNTWNTRTKRIVIGVFVVTIIFHMISVCLVISY